MSSKRIISVFHARSNGSPIGTRVLIDGVDVTENCYSASVYADGTGVVCCFVRDADGHLLVEFQSGKIDVIREAREGKVEIIFP